MKEFIIEQINKPYAKYLIFGITVNSPLFCLDEIEKSIDLLNGDCIVFDQLLQTGNTNNRFLAMSIDNGHFDMGSARNMDGSIIDTEMRKIGCDFLRENAEILKHCILVSEQKEAITLGGNI